MFRRLLGGDTKTDDLEREDRRTALPANGVQLYSGAGGLLVVGTKFYTNAVKAVTGSMGRKGVTMTAALWPQPDNPHDKNAIGVYVHGQLVGHLGRDDAKAYRPVLEEFARRGLTGYCRIDIAPDPNPQYLFIARVFVDAPKRQAELLDRLTTTG